MWVWLSAPGHSGPAAIRQFVLRHVYGLFAILTGFLLAMISADGISRHLDWNFPDLYRNSVSLSIAISELSYGMRGFIGLTDVRKVLTDGGLKWFSDSDRTLDLSRDPRAFDRLLDAAGHMPNVDRSSTFVLYNNETGTIDYYMLALTLFGYHSTAFYWLFIVLTGCVAACFLVSFRNEPAFVIPCVLWLLLLLVAQRLEIDPTDLQIGTPANARFLPIFSVFPVLFALTLAAAGRPFRWIDGATISLAALVYALCETTRSYSLWQFGAVIGLFVLIVLARLLPNQWVRIRSVFSGHALWPLVVFATVTTGWIAFHHERRDAEAYRRSTFMGHSFWLVYIGSTQEAFAPRIPEFERLSGVTIGNSPDAYSGALVRIKIKERGEKLDDYIDGYFFDEEKRESIAREIAFDFWRQYPATMLRIHLRAFEPIWVYSQKKILVLVVACIALLVVPWPWSWALATAAGVTAGVYLDASIMVTAAALALYAVLPPARRARARQLMASGALLTALIALPLIVMPYRGLGGLEDQYYVAWNMGLLFLTVAPWDAWRAALKEKAFRRWVQTS